MTDPNLTSALEALESLRAEVQATRTESRMRGEETAHRLDKLDKRLDNLDRTDGPLATEVKSLGTQRRRLRQHS